MGTENWSQITHLGFRPDEASLLAPKDARQHIYWQASTSPHKHAEFIGAMFEAAIYPKTSLHLVNDLNQEFIEEWYELRQQWGKPDRSHSALSSLYFFTRDYVTPVRLLFASDSLLAANDNSTVHFMARDAYAEFLIATHLKRNNVLDNLPQFNYVPLSVRLMRQSGEPDKRIALEKYLRQFSFGNGKRHEIVDIGFTGEIPHLLNEMFPQDSFNVRFLINQADSATVIDRPVMANATGFMFDAHDPNKYGLFPQQLTRVFKRVMEDTFSGLSSSSTELQINGNQIKTNSRRYPRSYDTTRRELALRGIRDGLKIWTPAIQEIGVDFIKSEQNRLSIVSNFKQFVLYYEDLLLSDQIFVPHEPTNFDPNFKQ